MWKDFYYIKFRVSFILTETIFETNTPLNIKKIVYVYISDFPYKRQAVKGIQVSLKPEDLSAGQFSRKFLYCYKGNHFFFRKKEGKGG